MAKVYYQPGEDMPDTTENLGHSFRKGKATEVPAGPALAKLCGHPFFRVEDGNAGVIHHDASPPFEAREKSAGWWAIFDADGNEIGKSFRKGDAEAFNAFSDEEKTEHVRQIVADE